MGASRATVLQAFLVLCIAGALLHPVSAANRGAVLNQAKWKLMSLIELPNQVKSTVVSGQSLPTVNGGCRRRRLLETVVFIYYSGECYYNNLASFCDTCWDAIDPSTTTYSAVDAAGTIYGAAAENASDPTEYCNLFFYTE